MTLEGEKNNFQDFQDFAKREILAFAREHVDEDTARLLLSAARYPSIDMAAAVQQIEGLRTAWEKWPGLLQCEEFVYPPRLNREQASSEATARYKASLLSPFTFHLSPLTLADLTGGMGIDTLAFARVAGHVDYVERDPELCALMEHNCKALGITNVTVHCTDSLDLIQLSTLNSQLSTIYIDPARRAASGHKMTAFEDCQPDILAHLPLLRSHAQRLMVKASPMIDIDRAIEQLGTVSEVHVVAVKGECKEVLFLCDDTAAEPVIHCVNLESGHETCCFMRSEEEASTPIYCSRVGRYLYEPHAALMKGGAFRLIGQRFGLSMLAPNSHLYTADRLVGDFPGRIFEVESEMAPSRKNIAKAFPDGKAHVVVRNYPMAAEALQKQLHLREGGDRFLIATTVGSRRTAFVCRRIG